MKVLHVNTYDVGGAAAACRRIHLGLLDKGIDSKILLLRKTKNTPQAFKFEQLARNVEITPKYPLYKRIYNRIVKLFSSKESKENQVKTRSIKNFKEIDSNAEDFSFPYSNYDITQSSLYKEADIIQLNWVSGFLDEETFFAKNTKPVVWRMPDLYACGGGYHYEIGFPFESFKNILDENTKIRKKSLIGKNIVFVPISKWIEQKANASSIIGSFPKKLIHNGVDFKVFKPHDKCFARKVFNLPPDKTILLFGSDLVTCKRKGISILFEALKDLDNKNIQLVTFGQNPNVEDVDYISVGEIKDELLLSVLYSAADYFIMPSIEEAFGQVTIEALACGVPVISFPNGGSSDIIINGLNGILAKGFSSNDLGIAIDKALSIVFDKQIIIKDVQERFNIADKINEYISLYKEILSDKN